ncbi:hypothetical protein Syun_004106 [Stephania yunnanensis]|uniref:Pentatricopeptide repeat-containing protein n=1 Tax=Stephania yunnanensis TaxID=152371 RepID=A0AAP0L5Q3_9MAGN
MKLCYFNFTSKFSMPNTLFSTCFVGSVTAVKSLAIHTSNAAIDHTRYAGEFLALVRHLSLNSKNYLALHQLDSMLAKTHLLDSATSVLVIDGLCQLNKLSRAVTVLSCLRKRGTVPDNFLYSVVVYCMVRNGGIHGVESVWNEVCGPNSSSERRIDASDFIAYICKSSSSVLEVESLCERVVIGGWFLGRQSYIALIGALCRNNKCSLAKNMLINMKTKGFEPDNLTYLVMFQCLCRNGYLVEADSVLRKLVRSEFSVDICVYGSFLHGLCKKGLLREADKLFDKMLERDYAKGSRDSSLKKGRRVIFQLNCSGAVPEIIVYETYFRCLCSVGRLNKAEKLLKEMMLKRSVLEVCIYKSFVKSLFRAGRAEDAIKFFNAQRGKGTVPVEALAESVIRGLCEIKCVDDAWRIFVEFYPSNGFVFANEVCNCILSSYWRSGKQMEAKNLFKRMLEGSFGGPNVSTYLIMLKGLCDEGNLEKALNMFEELVKKDVPVTGILYEVIIIGFCRCGNLAKAQKYLNKMIEDGHLLSYNRWKSLYDSSLVGRGNGVSL